MLRMGVDLAWYIRNPIGNNHGVNGTTDPVGTYNYLVHGWKNNGGSADGNTLPAGFGPNSGSGGGGFYTAFAYEVHSPPLYPPQYPADRNWIIKFIQAANADSGGQKAKVYIRLVPQLNFDITLLGTIWNFLESLGTADKNPSVLGFGFRGGAPGLYTQGGACSGGIEGNSYLPASEVYGAMPGTDGLPGAFPTTATRFNQLWAAMQSVVNSFGYRFGVSTGLSPMEQYIGASAINAEAATGNPAGWWMQDTGYGVAPDLDPTGTTLTYNTWYSRFTGQSGVRDFSITAGVVGGEWDWNWFYLNPTQPVPKGQPGYPYNMTESKFRAIIDGACDGYQAWLNAGHSGDLVCMLYGMPELTNDFSRSGGEPWPFTCYYNQWWLQECAKHSSVAMTDFSPVPAPSVLPPVPLPVLPPLIFTGSYIAVHGDPKAPLPSWTQTYPVYCCGADTYTVAGALQRLDNGAYIGGKTVKIMFWDYPSCSWKPLVDPVTGVPVTAVTTAQPPSGLNTNWGPITVYSPALPGTVRNQAWFYPEFDGDLQYGASVGVLEDLPIIPATVQTALTIAVKKL